jgi:hypothetical protein
MNTKINIIDIRIIPGSGLNVLGEGVEVLDLANGGTYEKKISGYAKPLGVGDFQTPEAAQAAIAARLAELTGPEFADIAADAAVKRMERDQARQELEQEKAAHKEDLEKLKKSEEMAEELGRVVDELKADLETARALGRKLLQETEETGKPAAETINEIKQRVPK